MSLRMVVPEMAAPGGPALNHWLLEWCSSRIFTGNSFQLGAVAIGVAKDNHLLAVAAFDNLRKGRLGTNLNIECSIASESPRWVTKGTLRALFHYPFCQLRVQRLTCLIAESNERSLKFNLGLGFKSEGRIRAALDNGEDLIVTGMIREESRKWLGSLLDG